MILHCRQDGSVVMEGIEMLLSFNLARGNVGGLLRTLKLLEGSNMDFSVCVHHSIKFNALCSIPHWEIYVNFKQKLNVILWFEVTKNKLFRNFTFLFVKHEVQIHVFNTYKLLLLQNNLISLYHALDFCGICLLSEIHAERKQVNFNMKFTSSTIYISQWKEVGTLNTF